jgi:hypothetical protein
VEDELNDSEPLQPHEVEQVLMNFNSRIEDLESEVFGSASENYLDSFAIYPYKFHSSTSLEYNNFIYHGR